MDASDRAVALFSSGWNCAESTFRALTEGIPGADAWTRAAAPFGAGLAWEGHVCGAVTGCAMALGVSLGRAHPGDAEAKTRTYAAGSALVRRVEEQFGSVQCRVLTGLDFHLARDRERYHEDVHTRVCVPLVRAAVRIAEEEEARVKMP